MIYIKTQLLHQKQDCRSEAKEMAQVFKLYFIVLYSLVWKAVDTADEILKRWLSVMEQFAPRFKKKKF